MFCYLGQRKLHIKQLLKKDFYVYTNCHTRKHIVCFFAIGCAKKKKNNRCS